jgi:hypothetical protein
MRNTNKKMKLIRSGVVLSEFLRRSTGCRGSPFPHHRLSYSCELNFRGREVFDFGESEIRLLLYDGTIQGHGEYKRESAQWGQFFGKKWYWEYIKWDYKCIPHPPRGLVFDHDKQSLVMFDDPVLLDKYFTTHCVK